MSNFVCKRLNPDFRIPCRGPWYLHVASVPPLDTRTRLSMMLLTDLGTRVGFLGVGCRVFAYLELEVKMSGGVNGCA